MSDLRRTEKRTTVRCGNCGDSQTCPDDVLLGQLCINCGLDGYRLSTGNPLAAPSGEGAPPASEFGVAMGPPEFIAEEIAEYIEKDAEWPEGANFVRKLYAEVEALRAALLNAEKERDSAQQQLAVLRRIASRESMARTCENMRNGRLCDECEALVMEMYPDVAARAPASTPKEQA